MGFVISLPCVKGGGCRQADEGTVICFPILLTFLSFATQQSLSHTREHSYDSSLYTREPSAAAGVVHI